jgi:hypothetical protein
VASKRIGRGTIDSRHGGETHIDAVHRLFHAMLARAPHALDELRECAPEIAAEDPGVSPTLDEYLTRHNLANGSGGKASRGYRLSYEFWRLASACAKNPGLSWPELLAQTRTRRDHRLQEELAAAYENDQRSSYVAEVRRRHPPNSPPLRQVAPVIAKFERPHEPPEHAELAQHFHLLHKLTGVAKPPQWSWPRTVAPLNPLAPIQPNLFIETEEAFVKRARAAWRAARAEAKRLGFADTPLSKAYERYEWFVRYQINGEPLDRIMVSAPGLVSRSGARDGVGAVATLLGVTVRRGQSGRPKGAKAVKPFRRGR